MVAPELDWPLDPEPPRAALLWNSTPRKAVGPMCTVAEAWWFSICATIAAAAFTGTAKP